MLRTWLFVAESDQIRNLKIFYRRVQTLIIFLKTVQTSRPWGENLCAKWEILIVLGAVFAHFCRDGRKIWHKFHVYRENGENPILDHWVKTIPAWLRTIRYVTARVASHQWLYITRCMQRPLQSQVLHFQWLLRVNDALCPGAHSSWKDCHGTHSPSPPNIYRRGTTLCRLFFFLL